VSGDDRKRAFLAEVRRHLDASAEALDPEIRRALAHARARALAAGEERAARWRWPAAAIVAAAGALLLALWLRPSPPEEGTRIAGPAPAGELDLIEDLEFYAWLVEQPDAG
jgi:hypothetical protein